MELFKRLDITNASKLLTDKLESWVEGFITALPNALVAALVFLVAFFASKLIRKVSGSLLDRVTENSAVANLLKNTIYIISLVTGAFIALEIMNLDKTVTSLLAGAGVIGLALGFAFQEIAANFIAGVLIAFRKPFKLGDLVKLEDYYGKVTDINMRTTTITTLQGLDVIVPNKKLFTEPFMNYTLTNKRRMDLSVGVSYGDDLQKVEDLVRSTLAGLDSRDKNKDIEFFYKEFGDSSINFDVRVWHSFSGEKDFLQIQHESIKAIKKAFDQNDITIPFPIRTLDFGIKGGATLSEEMGRQNVQ